MKGTRIWMVALISLFLVPLASAFMSPSTLSLIAGSLGSFIWSLVILIIVNIVLFARKTGRKLKRIVLVLSIIAIIVFSPIAYGKYREIKRMNEISIQIKGLEGQYDEVPLEEYTGLYNVSLKSPIKEYSIDLNQIPQEEIDSSKILFIHNLKIWKNIGNKSSEEYLSYNGLKLMYTNLSGFMAKYDIKEDDKIILICHRGWASSQAALYLRNNGYDAKSAGLVGIHNEWFVNKYLNITKISSLVTLPYDGEEDPIYIYFSFYKDQEMGYRKDIDRIDEDILSVELITTRNIVCFTEFHCVVTKYFLDYHNVTKKYIYQMGGQ